MEFKVRRESESLLEKTFKHWAGRKGVVRSGMIEQMMKQMQLAVDAEELGNVIVEHDKSGSGAIDLEAFNKIALHFLLKQVKHDHDFDNFIHKHEIGLGDFSE